MKSRLRAFLLRGIDSAWQSLNKRFIFRQPAQKAHDSAINWLRRLERLPPAATGCKLLHRLVFPKTPVEVGGIRLSQRLILAAGLVKGDGFDAEAAALQAVIKERRNITPGWRALPALLGPVEFGSFTRHPRRGNPGLVIWRDATTRSTQNRIGLRNPGARAAARFFADRRGRLPAEFGINIAVTPGLDDIDQQERDIIESLEFFLDSQVLPNWFTLNLSCPNTEDDPRGHQLEAETRQLCGAMTAVLQARSLSIPLWVKISPGLAAEQYHLLVQIFGAVGVRAIIASNTLAQPSPANPAQPAGIGGGGLFDETLAAIHHLRAAMQRTQANLDIIACGGILDGASFRQYQSLGVKAGQYWSALVYRGPFAAAIIESELARHDLEFEAVRRESLA